MSDKTIKNLKKNFDHKNNRRFQICHLKIKQNFTPNSAWTNLMSMH